MKLRIGNWLILLMILEARRGMLPHLVCASVLYTRLTMMLKIHNQAAQPRAARAKISPRL